MQSPPRRTLIVLGALVGAMTVASTLLLALERAQLRALPLHSLEGADGHASKLFNTNAPVDPMRWQRIEVRYSGTRRGSANMIHMMHRRLGISGLGYHFVIGNGDGLGDGEIQIGYRWKEQVEAALPSPEGPATSPRTISICIVGRAGESRPTARQLTELVWLTRQLQQRLKIPAEQIYIEPAPLFPEAGFRQQLVRGPF